MSTDTVTKKRGINYFTDLLIQNSCDSQGRTFLSGHIQYCRNWKVHRDSYAFRYYTSYLLEDSKNNIESYKELCGLINNSDFIINKIKTVKSVFPVLQDITYLINAAKEQSDFQNYGISLGLHSVLWEKGVTQVESGLVKLFAHNCQFQEAAANALHARSARDAFDLLLMIIQFIEKDKIEALIDISNALFDCIKRMDNEGTQAHHIHRVLYAVRLRNEKLALKILPECRQLTNNIRDEFQRLVSNLFLVQQVIPLDLDIAEEISHTVTGETFIGEERQVLMTLAALGRDAEPKTVRIDRLERLLKRAEELRSPSYCLETSLGIILEIFWEQPHIMILQLFVKIISTSLFKLTESSLSKFIDNIFSTKPIKVNNATSPYGRSSRYYVEKADAKSLGIGVVDARNLEKAISLLSKTDKDVTNILPRISDAFFERISKVEDSEKQEELLKKLIPYLRRSAKKIGGPAGIKLLEHLEGSLENTDKSEISLHLAEVAIGWYQLGYSERGKQIIKQCVEYINQSRDRIADGTNIDKKSDDSAFKQLSSFFSLFKIPEKSLKKNNKTEIELTQERMRSMRKILANALLEIPKENRLSAYDEIQSILIEYDDNDIDLSWSERITACALADVNIALAVRIIENIKIKDDRFYAVTELAEKVGEHDPKKAVAIMDSIALYNASSKVARNITKIFIALRSIPIPQNFCSQISKNIFQLKKCRERITTTFCCVRKMIDWSTSEAIKIIQIELESKIYQDCEMTNLLKVLVSFLKIIEGIEGEDSILKKLLLECNEKGIEIGPWTRKLACEKVSPLLALKDPKLAIDILKSVGELKEDLSAIADLIILLLKNGEKAIAMKVLQHLPEVANEIPKEEQTDAITQFVEKLALDESLSDKRDAADIWQWLIHESHRFWKDEVIEGIELFHIVYIAAIDPEWAISQWFEVHNATDEIIIPLIKKAIISQPVTTLEILSALPDSQVKIKCFYEAYVHLIEHPKTRLTIPSPFPLLQFLEDPSERGNLIASYLKIVPDINEGLIISTIKNLSLPEERLRPIEFAIEFIEGPKSEVLLEIIKDTIKTYIPNKSHDDDFNSELCDWALIAGKLSFDTGVEILKRVTDTYDRRKAAVELFKYTSHIMPKTIIELAEGFDEFDKCDLVEDLALYLSLSDFSKGEALIKSLDNFLEKEDQESCLKSVIEKLEKEKIRRTPDVAISEIKLIPDQEKQAERLIEILESLEDIEKLRITRWDDLGEIIDGWVETSKSFSKVFNYDYIEKIVAYAPDLAYERIRSKPESEKKADIRMKLLGSINRPSQIYLLDIAFTAYRNRFNELLKEDYDLFSITCDEFLEKLRDRIKKWNTNVIDASLPRLIQTLNDFPGNRLHRDEIVLEILKKVSINNIDFNVKLINMIDTNEYKKQANEIIIKKLPEDKLMDFIQHIPIDKKNQISPEGEATNILGNTFERIFQINLGIQKKEDNFKIPNENYVKAFSLIAYSYIHLRHIISKSNGISLLVVIFKLLHRIITPKNQAYPFASLLNKSSVGIDASDAGKEVGKLLSNLTLLPENIASDELETISKIIIDGSPDTSLPPLLGSQLAPIRDSNGSDFIEQLFLKLREYKGDLKSFVKRCLNALFDSYNDKEDLLADLLIIAENVKSSNAEVRKHFGYEVIKFLTIFSEKNDELKEALPIFRIFLASELFLPNFLLDCIQWMRLGLDELIIFTSSNELTSDLFNSLTRISYCLGRIVVLRQCDHRTLSSIEQHIWDMLLSLAELEYLINSSRGNKKLKKKVLKSLNQLKKDFDVLEEFFVNGFISKKTVGLHNRRKSLCKSFLLNLKYALRESSQETNIDNLSEEDTESEDSPEEFDSTKYLFAFAGFWKIGLNNLEENRNEIMNLMCQLAKKADLDELKEEKSIFEVNQKFEVELYVRSISMISRKDALEFVKALTLGKEDISDFGLFDQILLVDPKWVFLNIEAIGSEKDISEKIDYLVKRLGKEAPSKLLSVLEILMEIATRHGDWVFRANVLEAVGLALSKKHIKETEIILKELPEFSAFSEVWAELVKVEWKRDPQKALGLVKNIELLDVRCNTLIDCAKMIPFLPEEQPIFEIINKMITLCGGLINVEQRFKASLECLSAIFFIKNMKFNKNALNIVFKFMELFKSGPIQWLQLAFVNSAPILSLFLSKETISKMGQNIFSSRTLKSIEVKNWFYFQKDKIS
ncbi:MAG: hypothetical protein GTO45_10795 [Candidatus Aminicenantes bacterium]|nr:hypothetical protein [Candidatus Aminicenantes bacterium]NIM79294.1 hypothetical protein [Candidatus Aminicenantes bacterium]NIN18580.1 hypothetical protein [Candidatus Aminicenantes bacterium]NIN85235.1 hypothetical protein [Candidatus Aminicenantes bacterium]NIO81462.1 hypothetical protein [Candidatus Aminicenantes bacterium]